MSSLDTNTSKKEHKNKTVTHKQSPIRQKSQTATVKSPESTENTDKQTKVVDNVRPRRQFINDSSPTQAKVKNLSKLKKSMTVDNSNMQVKKATSGKADSLSPRRKPAIDHLNVQGKPTTHKATGNHSPTRKLVRENSKSRQKPHSDEIPTKKKQVNKVEHIENIKSVTKASEENIHDGDDEQDDA
ncbi:unnamed protein product [Adineta ricciae]|uniref:Uncharacterized protein n=1 Tax=Adineta ricciae TaxID=249248 RepID=A0A815BK23_ADIRI|nr:unnamed protein product [Adineta ricciae]CAF1310766.1 unnamed protein product [Adineta ricciae]